jgi:acetylornithine aminotransferase/acetylornithine/N-succinyldiaminopimelate aminotransferase
MTAPRSGGLDDTAAIEAQFYMSTFRRLPVEFASGAGWTVVDDAGREYLDFVAGLAVNVLGHCHPRVVEAIRQQAGMLIHASNLYYTRPQVELARRLADFGFSGRAFFTNSGAEANETAIKIARKWGRLNRGGAYVLISATGSFHGRTLATTAATGQEHYQKSWAPLPDGFKQVAFNDFGALCGATTKKTVAVMLEPVQGEGGVIPADPAYLSAVRKWCDSNNLLLILDEIQTGLGRTGTFYAFQGYGISPDIVTLAKGIGGGVPIGACVAAPRADVLEPGDHGSTFGGNPLACAAALATLAAVEEERVVENARVVGDYLAGRLQELVRDFQPVQLTRGRGLMQALLLDQDVAPQVQLEALHNGLVVNAATPRVIRLVPPLTIGEPEVDRAIAILAHSLDAVLTHAGTTAAR